LLMQNGCLLNDRCSLINGRASGSHQENYSNHLNEGSHSHHAVASDQVKRKGTTL
jgi:hypothetical protein